MNVLRLLEKTVNGALEPLGVKIVRTGPAPTIGGRRFSDDEVVAKARERGVSPGEFVEELFGKKGRAQEIIKRMQDHGAISASTGVVCEIGPGSGLYVEKVLKLAPVKQYEIYEISTGRAEFLAKEFPVVQQRTDGETLQATPSRSVDLIHAHGVFVTTEFLITWSYFREIERVIAPGGYVVFDVITEDCLEDAILNSWIKSPLRYASMISRDLVIEFFVKRGFSLIDEFRMSLLVHGMSRYLIMRKDETKP
jgi:hypothetical protein